MPRSRPSFSSARGVSVVEMMVVLGVTAVLSGAAAFQFGTARPAMRGDGAMRVVMSQMRIAREMAITQRRYMRVSFTTPNLIQIEREEVPGPATTVLSQVLIEGGIQYALVTGVPDTPDKFGASSPVYFGVVTNVKFTPDGTLVNQDGQGANGTVFLAQPKTARSARAVTVLGSTGRIRGYRWDGRNWVLV